MFARVSERDGGAQINWLLFLFLCKLIVMKTIALLLTGFLFITSCNKKDTLKDCETNNYGVVHINFTSTANRHSIIANGPGGSNVRDKITPSGISSDTVHLSPDTWVLAIASIDAGGSAISQDTKTAITTKCSDETFTVTF